MKFLKIVLIPFLVSTLPLLGSAQIFLSPNGSFYLSSDLGPYFSDEVPTYTDKLLYALPGPQTVNSVSFAPMGVRNQGSGNRYSERDAWYVASGRGTYRDPFIFVPNVTDEGNPVTVSQYVIFRGRKPNDHTTTGYNDVYNTFTIKVEVPEFIGPDKIALINQGPNTVPISSFFKSTITTGVRFTLDGAPETTIDLLGLSPGDHIITATKEYDNGIYTGSFKFNVTRGAIPAGAVGASSDRNFIITRVFKEAGVNESNVNNIRTVEVENQRIEYFDGLGRPSQSVQCQASPFKNDMVVPIVYDAFGRESIKYEPYSTTSNGGAFRAGAISSQLNFYSGQSPTSSIKLTSNPYSQTVFQANPLNRVQEQGAPGSTWQPVANSSAGHTMKMEYGANATGEVKLWVINSDNNGATASLYQPGTLYKTVMKDENWVTSDGKSGTTEEYKDKEGNVVLKRAFNSSPAGMQTLSTYYVYDDYGNLRLVLTPGSNPDAESVPSQAVLDNFCYQYRYDQRKRLIQKKIPGKLGWEEVIYNPIDQPVFTQDSVQRAAQQRSFVKYDAFGRVVMTGVEIGHADNRQNIQDIVNTLMPLWETRDNSQTNFHGYNNLSCPSNRPNLQPEVINYYDDYNIPDLPNNLSANFSKMTKGLLTATKIKVLGTVEKYLWTVNYYDDKGNLTGVYQQHYKGAVQSAENYDMISNTYTFTGQLLSRTRSHYVNGTQNLYVYNEYSYDHMGRLINSKQKTGDNSATSNPLVLLSKNTYDEIGQLISKGLHGTGSVPVFAQTVTYKYNERGWLSAQSAPLFAMELKYQLDSAGLVPQYNGNISAQKWGLNTSLSKQYVYRYDNLNRLSTSISKDNNNERIGYDLMGNLTRLQRDATGSLADQIRYNYSNGNRLESVVDSNAHMGVNFQLPGTTSYTYDPNGNMIERINTTNAANNMYSMSYNHLNLPTGINANGAMITYTYDATGNKLKKQVTGSVNVNNDYISGIQYEDGVLKFVSLGAGRVVRNSATDYSYEYTLTDHLGNGRVFFNVNSSGTATKIQETDYYAFGLDIQRSLSGTENKYQYNAKEKQDQEKMLDYGARFYDSVIGRWNVVDPLAEDYDNLSPYNYVANNPVNNTDPDGRSIEGREGFFNDYHYDPSGRLNFVVIKPGDDHFFQTDKRGNTTELQGSQLTPSMSAQYLFAASKLSPNDGVHLNEVEIKGQAFKAYTIVPYVTRSISLIGEAGLETVYPIESLFPALRTFQAISTIFLLSKDGHFNQAHKYSGLTGSQIISKFKRGSVREVFPEEYNDVQWEVIVKEANRGVRAAKTAYKLLSENRFNK